MPIGMYTFGIVLLVRDATGSFATAGRIAGAFGLANALGAVLQGRLMDRLGQRRVLRAAAVVHLLAVGALVLAATEGAPAWALTACALAGGGSLPQVPAAMRSLWSALVAEEASRQTAYALVTIVFEVSVVTAPVLVAAIAAASSPSGRRSACSRSRCPRSPRAADRRPPAASTSPRSPPAACAAGSSTERG